MPYSFRISKTVRFEASHVLEGLPPGHQCGNLHGHSWVATVEIVARNLDDAGMALDFGAVGAVVKTLDHRHLNDILGKDAAGKVVNPTSENVARWIYENLTRQILKLEAQDDVKVVSVRVEETCTSAVTLEPE